MKERRPWKPITKKRLKEIRDASDRDNNTLRHYETDEVYALACELESLRMRMMKLKAIASKCAAT